MEVEKFVDWCFRAYRLADEVEKDGISGLQTSLAHELNQWLGIEEVTNEGKVIIVGCDVSHIPDFVNAVIS